MKSNIQLNRLIHRRLPDSDQKRMVLLTGARQVGKTTSLKSCYRNLPNFNLDAPEYRIQLQEISSFSWAGSIGNAIIDEVQKLPSVLDKIKFTFDEGGITFTVVSGSAQVLPLKSVRESMAGRVFVYEQWPLTLAELCYGALPDFPELLFSKLFSGKKTGAVLQNEAAIWPGEKMQQCRDSEEHLLQWGGMPGLLSIDSDRERKEWLRSYNLTYLERDLSDLSRMSDLLPFRKFHHLSALRCTGLLNYSSLAADAGIAVTTARRYLEYLAVSYQTFLLQPYAKNLTSTVVKTPKIYWSDIGLLRELTGREGAVDGCLFENHVIAELYKLVKTVFPGLQLYFYRTRSGLELGCLLVTPEGIIGMEIKNRETIKNTDTRTLRLLSEQLDKEWLGGIVVYRGNSIRELDKNLFAVPSWRLFT